MSKAGDSSDIALETSTDRAANLPAGLSEDWRFERDLLCPTCRYNLRMLRQPCCPECGTTFRWQALLNVTCPRCGESLAGVGLAHCPWCRLQLDWTRLLSDADPQHLHHFEYARRPLRPALRTMFAVLLPVSFWRGIQLEHLPARDRLRAWRRSAWGALFVGLIAVLFANRQIYAGIPWAVRGVLVYVLAAALPAIVGLFGLVRFTPTLARFRIRRDQLLRVSAYGYSGLGWLGLLMLVSAITAEIINIAALGFLRTPGRLPPAFVDFDTLLDYFQPWIIWFLWPIAGALDTALLSAFAVFGLLWWWWFYAIALVGYLRLKRGDAMAIFASTQGIAILAIAVLLINFTPIGLFIGKLLLPAS
jgi:hypothetical protein